MDLLSLIRAQKAVADYESGEHHASVYLLAQVLLATHRFNKLSLSAKNDRYLKIPHCGGKQNA